MNKEKIKWNSAGTDVDLFVNHAQIRPKYHKVSKPKDQEEEEYPDCVWP